MKSQRRPLLEEHRRNLEAQLGWAADLAAAGDGIVSLDVFDTLLIRLMPDRFVRGRAARLLAEKLKGVVNAQVILAHRRRFTAPFEQRSRNEESEWRLTDWLADLAARHGLPAETVPLGEDAEVEAEQTFTAPAAGTCQLLNRLRERGLTLIAVSDTWLDDHLLARLLMAHGLKLDRVFTSATAGCSKRVGGLFHAVSSTLAGKKAVHVGDNLKSDLFRPYGAGWRGVWLPAPAGEAAWSWRPPRPAARDVLGALRCEQSDAGPLQATAHDLLAPLLILQLLLAKRRFEAAGVEHVVFLARDAHLMRAAAEELQLQDHGFPPWSYLRLARKAVTLAHGDDLLFSLTGTAGRFGRDRAGAFLGQFWLPGDLRDELLTLAGLQVESRLDAPARQHLADAITRTEGPLRVEQERQRELIRRYLRQHTGGARRVGIIDSGWAATTQDALASIELELDLISGVYLGVSAQGRAPTARSQKVGLIRDDYSPPPRSSAIQRLAGVVRLWDTVLRESAGTATALEETEQGQVIAKLSSTPAQAAAHACQQMEFGVRGGVRARCAGAAALLTAGPDLPEDALRAAAVFFGQRLAVFPPGSFARVQLEQQFDETSGAVADLAWSPRRPRDGWLPGELASRGLWPLLPLVQGAVEVAGWLERWRKIG